MSRLNDQQALSQEENPEVSREMGSSHLENHLESVVYFKVETRLLRGLRHLRGGGGILTADES